MKRIVILLATVFLFGLNCVAQNESKFKSVKDNIAKNDIAIQNPKKNVNPATWMERGKLFQEAYNVNLEFVRFGMPENEVELFFLKKPHETLVKEEDGVEKKSYVYSQITLHFDGGLLRTWEETQTIAENPLSDAVQAYEKAKSLDVKGKNTKKIEEAYKSISNDLGNKFLNEYYNKKYVPAFNTAVQRIDVNKLLGITDTIHYFFAGYAAVSQSEIDSSMWQKAVDYFEKALSHGFTQSGDLEGQIYHLLYSACYNSGDPEKALGYAKMGFEKNPNYPDLMIDLINYYLRSGENHKTLEYIEQAVAKDPQNANLRFAQGVVLNELGEQEKSLAAYDAAIAINPNYYGPIYNKGVMYFNSAVKLMEDADRLTDAEYNRLKDLADAEFAKAIPYIEKALELKPDDTAPMDLLKTLYFRLRSKNPEYETKYNDMSKKLESMKSQ